MKNYNTQIEEIIHHLKEKNQTISFAESCTGGRIATAFTSVSGASSVLNGSVVSYSNNIKHQWLEVEQKVLEHYGAVSKECVLQMLVGIQKMAKSDYAIAVSGIAGPTGGTNDKPIGTVYIGLLTPFTTKVYHCSFKGDREKIQELSVQFSIEKLLQKLKI